MIVKPCKDPECQQQNPQPLTNFAKAKTCKDGHRDICKDCRNRKERAKYAGEYGDRQRAANRAAYAANRPARLARNSQWAKDNRQRKTDKAREWREANRDRARKHDADRRAREYGTAVGNVDFELIKAVRPDCYLCGLLLGEDVHVDHVVPISRGGAHDASNLLPTHAECNQRKHNKLLCELDWYAGSADPFDTLL